MPHGTAKACRTSSTANTPMVTPIDRSSICQALGTGKPWRQPTRTVAQQPEPQQAAGAGTRHEPATQCRRLLGPDTAHQQHGVQVHMGVEQGEGRSLGQCTQPAQPSVPRRGLHLPGVPRPAQRLPAIHGQERGPGQRQRTRQLRPVAQRLCHARHTRADQHGITDAAEQHHTAHMFAAQPLAQHERVLRTDGHDQPQAQQQAFDEDRKDERSSIGQVRHTPSLPCLTHEGRLSFLHPI